MRQMLRFASPLLRAALAATIALVPSMATAQGAELRFNVGGDGGESGYVKLVLLFASVSLAPALLAVITSFGRILVVLLFLRAGLGAQEIPPTQIVIGLALLLAIVTMMPTLTPIWENAAGPLLRNEIDMTEAATRAAVPMREFMARQTRPQDLQLMYSLTETKPAEEAVDAPMSVLASAFAISEMRAAFLIGFVVYLPFVIIDLVVASTLASVGLLSVPAPLLALPFKVLLFVMVDGWALLTEALVRTFN